VTPAGIEPATFRFVAQHLNHCATAVPMEKNEINVNQSHYRPEVPRMVVKLSALRAGRLYPQEILPVLISDSLSRPQRHSAIGRILCQ